MADEKIIGVVVIGAGLGGISTAIALQNQLGHYDYTIYEMAEAVGGTWFENTYPGCGCDTPSHWYSLSTEPNPNWSMVYPLQAEIRTYWEGLAEKHKISPHIEFSTEVISAVWDEDGQVYTITLRNVRTQDTRQVKAKAVVSAVGVFHKPKFPNIPGQDRFKGVSMHARMWDHSVDFSNKKVAVVGNGCTGTQIVTALSNNPTTNIVNFCRTPSWFRPRHQAAISETRKWMIRNIPFFGTLIRNYIAIRLDATYANWGTGVFGTFLRRRSEKKSIDMVKRFAPDKHHENLIPKYPMGCKRIVVNPGYLESLQRPNVELEFEAITEITESGIVTKSGKNYDFDIICYATGFDVEGSSTISVTGAGGKTMAEYFKEEGGATAYMGTTHPGFPNWFTLLGPNTVTGLSSAIFIEEVQINYALQLIKPILRGQAKSFSPTPTATRAYNDWIQKKLTKTVWTSCFSWYHANADGGPSQGKLIATWPGSQAYFRWLLRTPVWSAYEAIGGEKWLQRRKMASTLTTVAEIIVLGASLGAWVLFQTNRWDSLKRLVVEQASKLPK